MIYTSFQTAIVVPFTEVKLFWDMIVIVYFLQVCGILSHPYVLFMYLIEQISIHLFGTSPRSSDIRILFYFVINFIFAYLSLPVLKSTTSIDSASAFIYLTVALSFLASHNLLFSLGMKRPFEKESGN